MEVTVRRALTNAERERAISTAFAKAQQVLPREARYGPMEDEWISVVDGVVGQGSRFHWSPEFTRQPILFAELAASRLGYEVHKRKRYYDSVGKDQTPLTLQADRFRTCIPPDLAVKLIRRFETELRLVVGADKSEAGTVAPLRSI